MLGGVGLNNPLRRYLLLIAVGAGSIARPVIAAERFETRLAPSPLTNGTRENITGEGTAYATLDGSMMRLSGNFHGLQTHATTAEIHFGLGIGVMGPPIFSVDATQKKDGAILATLRLTDEQIDGLRRGQFYIQINSEKAPDGNLTGWLLPPHVFPGEDVPEVGHGFLPQLDIPRH